MALGIERGIKKILKPSESRNMVRVLESALGRINVCRLTGKLFAFQADERGSSPLIHKYSPNPSQWNTRIYLKSTSSIRNAI